ncbi:hypothetical protein [Streptomyces sp. CB01881]|uniref:hypothetical protein n=1 Tax=Streptomyces sp. CB01881 TaxID=2078691 RepID=UPI000CDC9964|nr:hypothetical protein [Streptomyces sp. CB01881]AUY50469.1 hypothetical protein C2142_17710 [Streptomyces sp. CB01881]TYC73856.1 hypothetical protein EH183_17690 [Streptomyces sp. CB01881]
MLTTAPRRPHPAPAHILGARWLASANRQAATAFTEWRAGQLAAIETGRRFNVVRVTDQRLGTAALQDMQLAGVVVGPVLLNRPRHAVEFLIALRQGEHWQMRDSELITRAIDGSPAVTVAMPAPGLPRTQGRTWLVPPDGRQFLTHPHNLANALRRARTQLRRPPARRP